MVSNEICRVCRETFTTKEFGRHLRKHKIRIQDYYETHFPKTDLYTQEKITYRDRESYFLHDFEGRANLISYLTKDPSPHKDRYAIVLLARHKKFRGWQYQPSQVELRSSVLPARNFYEQAFGSFAPVCESAGLTPRFEDSPTIKVPETPEDFEILYDTREQKPLEFSVPSQRVTLNFGDYTVPAKYDSGLVIERKSLIDFVNTMSQHYERFQAELDRAKAAGSYVVVLVETALVDALRFKIHHSKCTPVFIFHRVKMLMQQYDNLQFIFANGRQCAAELALNILLLGEQAKTIDLQYHHEKGQICGTA